MGLLIADQHYNSNAENTSSRGANIAHNTTSQNTLEPQPFHASNLLLFSAFKVRINPTKGWDFLGASPNEPPRYPRVPRGAEA